jgi:hypothetical protein
MGPFVTAVVQAIILLIQGVITDLVETIHLFHICSWLKNHQYNSRLLDVPDHQSTYRLELYPSYVAWRAGTATPLSGLS